MEKFTEISLLPEIQQSLHALGFTKPTVIQAKIIPLLLEPEKHDVHAQAQTGTGKTLAFGIPLLHAIDVSRKKVQGLILAPTRELVLQIYESLKDVSRSTGIIIEPIYGGMPIERQISAIKRGAHIIVGTPGRVNDHLRRKTLTLEALRVLVLDEADIMLDMGFREEVDIVLATAPRDRQIWLFSATVGSGIKQLINTYMHDVVSVKAPAVSVASPQVKHYYCVVAQRNRVDVVARFIEAAPDFYGIIFCQTKLLTTEVMEQLASKGFRVNCLHGDMKQALRTRVIKGFKDKDFNILVATDVAARGIDVADLTHVINFSLPDEYETYVHRSGRTGRAGKEGIAITFIAHSEQYRIKKLEKVTGVTLHELPIPPLEAIINAKIGAVADFVEQAKKSVDEKPTRKVLSELVNSFTQEEVRNALVVALEDLFFKDIIHEDLNSIRPHLKPQEICIELGQDAGLDEATMRDYLYTTCTLMPQDVRKVRVLNRKTFISIPENRLHDCLQSIKQSPLSAKPYKAYLVEDIYERPGRTQGGRFEQRRREKRRPSKRRR